MHMILKWISERTFHLQLPLIKLVRCPPFPEKKILYRNLKAKENINLQDSSPVTEPP